MLLLVIFMTIENVVISGGGPHGIQFLGSLRHLNEIGFLGTPQSRAVEMAKLAVSSGARAIVCSPLEIEGIRAVVPASISIITPGIRPKGSAGSDDQKRVMDPKSAIQAGANYLVIGRPITSASDIGAAAKAIYEETL